ncbi:MAG TPA: hypothetical protein VEI74_09760 [Candidatus Methylomirabilis sp.]|nr:hypothetical protein [Candidatus Methylomirabilis sp.]
MNTPSFPRMRQQLRGSASVQFFLEVVNFPAQLLQKLQLPHGGSRPVIARGRVLGVRPAELCDPVLQATLDPIRQLREILVRILRLPHLVQIFAPLHLLHQKSGVHRCVGFLPEIHITQAQKITAAPDRILEDLKSFVDERSHLHGETPLVVGSVRKLVRVNATLQLAITHGKVVGIDIERCRQSKQFKMIFARSDLHARGVRRIRR